MTINKFVTAFALTIAAGAAFADNALPPEPAFVSTTTRAAVIAELAAAQASGEYRTNLEVDLPQIAASEKSRSEVKMELASAVRNNELPAIYN